MKRQRTAGEWSLAVLRQERVLQHFQDKLRIGDQCMFVSTQGSPQLDVLAERARDSGDWEQFDQVFLASAEQRKRFETLQDAWAGIPAQEVHRLLQGVRVDSASESFLRTTVEDRIAAWVEGNPVTIADVLAAYADNLIHKKVTAEDVWTHLTSRGFQKRGLADDLPLRDLLASRIEHRAHGWGQRSVSWLAVARGGRRKSSKR